MTKKKKSDIENALDASVEMIKCSMESGVETIDPTVFILNHENDGFAFISYDKESLSEVVEKILKLKGVNAALYLCEGTAKVIPDRMRKMSTAQLKEYSSWMEEKKDCIVVAYATPKRVEVKLLEREGSGLQEIPIAPFVPDGATEMQVLEMFGVDKFHITNSVEAGWDDESLQALSDGLNICVAKIRGDYNRESIKKVFPLHHLLSDEVSPPSAE
jgi:hypothetical protein